MGRTSGARAQSTAATRAALLGAARAHLSQPDPAPWSMEAVAAAAGVTRVTAYNQFGSRAGLVEAVLDEVVSAEAMDQLVTGTAALQPAVAVQVAVARTCSFWHAERTLLRRLFATAYTEPAIAELLERREGWRKKQWTALLGRLPQPPGGALDAAQAAEVLTAITSFPAYDRLGPSAADPVVAAGLLGHVAASLHGGPA